MSQHKSMFYIDWYILSELKYFLVFFLSGHIQWHPQLIRHYTNLRTYYRSWLYYRFLTLLPSFGGFHRTLQRMRLANSGRLLLRTRGPVPFGTCSCSNVDTILSWTCTCHIYGPFEFEHPSVLLFCFVAFLYRNSIN